MKCEEKRAYTSRKEARRVRRLHRGSRMYRCLTCGLLHLTTYPRLKP